MDMVIPTQAFEENIGKSARIYADRDYDGERKEHYRHVKKHHQPLKARSFIKKHPLPLKTWAPPIDEKDADDEACGFGSNFWPYGRQKQDKIAKKKHEYSLMAIDLVSQGDDDDDVSVDSNTVGWMDFGNCDSDEDSVDSIESDINDDDFTIEEDRELAMSNMEKKSDKIAPNTWLADSGASCHLTNSDEGMFDVEVISSPVKIGNGKALTATKLGKMRRTIVQKNGDTVDVTLTDVKYVPELWVNLFSIGKGLQNGFNIGNKGLHLFLTKGKTTILFDKMMKTNKGFILGVDMMPTTRKSCVATLSLDKGKSVSKKILHGILTHVGEDTSHKTAAYYNWKVVGIGTSPSEICDHCATAKSRQKNLRKWTEKKSEIAGERLFIDISSVKGESYSGSKYWLLVLDDCTDHIWSYFLTAKSHTRKEMIILLKELSAKYGKAVKYIRCDNAGENKVLEKECQTQGLGIQFEYTAPGTPQHNGRVERKFATLYSRIRSMMSEANFEPTRRTGIWTEAARTATLLDTILVSATKQEASHSAFFGKEAPFVRHLNTFGKVGVVLNHAQKIKGKLKDRGRHCIFLGYAVNHAGDVYRMLKLATNKILVSRDIIWLKQNYGDWARAKSATTSDEELDDDDEDFDSPTGTDKVVSAPVAHIEVHNHFEML